MGMRRVPPAMATVEVEVEVATADQAKRAVPAPAPATATMVVTLVVVAVVVAGVRRPLLQQKRVRREQPLHRVPGMATMLCRSTWPCQRKR